MGSDSLSSIVENCRDELVSRDFIQSEDEIMNPDPRWMRNNHSLLYRILDEISS